MSRRFDVVVVGENSIAGSALALRLARAGASVAIVDRDELGTDTLSTHAIWPNGIARLDELGILERLLEQHDVPLLRYRLRVLGHESAGEFTPVGGFDRMIAPRRVTLDRIFAETAIEAGVEGRYGEKVSGLLGAGDDRDPIRGVVLEGGERIEADWTIGADGRSSTVASKLGLKKTGEAATNMSMLLAYWRGLPKTDELSLDVDEHRGLLRFPGDDGVELLAVTGPPELTRGGPDARRRTYLEALGGFETTLDPAALAYAEQITGVRSAGNHAPRVLPAGEWPWVGANRRRRPLQASGHGAGDIGRDRTRDLRLRCPE